MKIAVVTGASSGIGRELLLAIDKEYDYDEIWAIARRADRLEELGKQCQNTLRPVCLDLNDTDSIDKYQQLLAQAQPEIAMLINAAGCGVFGPFEEQDLKAQLALYEVGQPYNQHGLQLLLAAGALSGCLRRQQELCPQLFQGYWERAAAPGYQCHVRVPWLDQNGVPGSCQTQRLYKICRPLVRGLGSSPAGYEGSEKGQVCFHPGRPGAAAGPAGEAPACEPGNGHLVQAAGNRIIPR